MIIILGLQRKYHWESNINKQQEEISCKSGGELLEMKLTTSTKSAWKLSEMSEGSRHEIWGWGGEHEADSECHATKLYLS